MQTQTSIPAKKGIDYILNSTKPYPDWIKQHQLFKELPKIDKIFPRIGLNNFKEPCEIINTQEAITAAKALGTAIITQINPIVQGLQFDLKAALIDKASDRDELCCNIQTLISFYSTLSWQLTFNTNNQQDFISVKDNTVNLYLPNDIFVPGLKNAKIMFKKGQGLLSVLAKLKERYPSRFVNIEQLPEFKTFSSANVGKKTYNVVFSSSDESGAWDIATASMRGVSWKSCQAWESPQSRGLIGSISSKYCAVIYLESEEQIHPYGTRMLYRSMVRFCFNKKTNKPLLVIDRMYPSDNEATIMAFKRALQKRSGMDVVFAPKEQTDIASWYIPNETTMAAFLKQGESSYMDAKIPVSAHKASQIAIASKTDIKAITTKFKAKIAQDITELVKAKKAAWETSTKELTHKQSEYSLAKIKWEDENKNLPDDKKSTFDQQAPTIDNDLATFFRNGLENFFRHCDKRYGENGAGSQFTSLILDCIPLPDAEKCLTAEEYHRKFVVLMLQNLPKIKEEAIAKVKAGSWHKNFPTSSERFFEFVFSGMKNHALTSIKDVIKGN